MKKTYLKPIYERRYQMESTKKPLGTNGTKWDKWNETILFLF
jgi:hypothetical protein